MRRRRYLAAGLGFGGMVLMGSTLYSSASARQDTDQTVESEPITFSDAGSTVTDEFELEDGVTIVESVHDGDSNFIVDLVPTTGNRAELLVNTIGAYTGATGLIAAAGQYLLDVDADGSWEIEIQQPQATDDDAESLPASLAGDTPDWAGPFQFDGLGEARGVHEGQGNFIVEILPQEESVFGLTFPELVFNELDQFEGETTFSVEGIGYVTVDAAGPWEVELLSR
ncbi:hypothetical protein [Natrialba chahannaoensis]|nr:hypothetical protein [Natrialba chahannaoensis]